MSHASGSILSLLLIATVSAQITELRPDTWLSSVTGRSWLIYFTVQGCKHCERLTPMMQYVAQQAPDLRVGRVDATEHNGLARTFRVQRFPTIMLFTEDGFAYEFEGRRSPPDLIRFGRKDAKLLGIGTPMPTELLPNVSELWLLAQSLYPPLKQALTWSVGIALAIKGCSTGLLRLLRRNAAKKGPNKERIE